MARKYWIMDISRKQRFGPYSNKKAAAKDRTQIRIIPDTFLETATSVGIANEDMELEFAEFADWPIGDLEAVKQQNAKLDE